MLRRLSRVIIRTAAVFAVATIGLTAAAEVTAASPVGAEVHGPTCYQVWVEAFGHGTTVTVCP